MTTKKAIYKVPDGKLLKIFLEEADGRIGGVKITGDFFAHPEENIRGLELALASCEIEGEKLLERIRDFLAKNKTELFGVDAESIALTIVNAK
jgi:lipoate-protein ligase A